MKRRNKSGVKERRIKMIRASLASPKTPPHLKKGLKKYLAKLLAGGTMKKNARRKKPVTVFEKHRRKVKRLLRKMPKAIRGVFDRNPGEGMGFLFHGSFRDKAAAAAKEKSRPGSFIRKVMKPGQPTRYLVMSPRKNPPTRRDELHHELHLLKIGESIEVREGYTVKRVSANQWKMGSLHGSIDRIIDEILGEESGWEQPPSKTKNRRRKARKCSTGNKPHARNSIRKRKRNYESASELYTKFHGRGPKSVLNVTDLASHPELGKLGDLVCLQVKTDSGEKCSIEWKTRQPIVAAEKSGRQIYFIGGDQALSPEQWEQYGVDTGKDLWDLGECFRIEYDTEKKFDQFQPITYYHKLGEESGIRPRLAYDKELKRLLLVGGNYEIKPEGIVD